MSTLELDSPGFLVLLAPLIAWSLYRLTALARRRTAAMRFSAVAPLEGLPKTIWSRLVWLPDALRGLACALLVLALARPQLAQPRDVEEVEGIDVVLAIDASCSMRAVDFLPRDRMHVAKQALAQIVSRRSNDRIGVVVFAGEAMTWVPPTLDYSMLLRRLEKIRVGMLREGTAIGSAIGVALNRLRQSDAKSRVLILLTDGDNNAGKIAPLEATALAKELAIPVYTVLIGRGGKVPIPYGRDVFGRVVHKMQDIPVDPALLRAISKETGGRAFQANDGSEIYARLDGILESLDRARFQSTVHMMPKQEIFPGLILASLLVLCIELLLRTTRLRRFP